MNYRSIILAGAALHVGLAQGMGLGNLDVQSYLGAPLKAHINLLSPGFYNETDIQVRTASLNIYDQLGVPFNNLHSHLDFDVLRDRHGNLFIAMSSNKTISEPYLDVVIELSWPQGSTYRRFNLLFDPPGYAKGFNNVFVPENKSQVTVADDQIILDQYRVQSGDSLWKIAKASRHMLGLSTQEMMAEIFQLNAKAFIQGDQNRIKLGALLTIPQQRSEPDIIEPYQDAVDQSNSIELVATESYKVSAPVIAMRPEPDVIIEPEKPAASSLRIEDVRTQLLQLQQERAQVAVTLQQLKLQRNKLKAKQVVASIVSAQTEVKVMSAEVVTPAAQTVSSEIINSNIQAVENTSVQNQAPKFQEQLVKSEGKGVWWLMVLIPFGLLVGLLIQQVRRVNAIKKSEVLKDEDLYEMVFGAQRDRSRSDSPEQVAKAIQHIKDKAGHQVDTVSGMLDEQGISEDEIKQMVEVYMLYSQHQKALNMLLLEVAKNPSRGDLRLFLMDIYARLGDMPALEEQWNAVQELCDEEVMLKAEHVKERALHHRRAS